jgi:hypothetical protein
MVYLAEDPVIKRQVAIKVIKADPGLADDEIVELQSRFEREFQSAGNLQHPNIITVFDVGREGDSTFFAMEYLPGEDLADVLKSDRVLSFKEIADYSHKICSALDHAHDHGVVHRDIKPANILIDRNREPKITDFGVAKLQSTNLTRTGTVVGTPSYMSPEQVTGQQVSGASDQFSVAVILYQMLTGELPFTGENPTTILYKIVHETPVSPHEKRQSLPTQIDQVLLRALEKKPESRYERCVDLANAAREALGVAAQELDLAFDRPDSTLQMRHHGARSAKKKQKKKEGKSKTPLIAGLVAAAVLAGAGAFLFLGGGLESLTGPPAATVLARTVVIQAAEGGAEIWKDGADTGLLVPAEIHISGDEGTPVRLELRRQGTVVASNDLVIDAAMPTEWVAIEEALPARSFAVATRPPGAKVFLDDELVAEASPADVQLVPGNEYTIRVELDGYHAESTSFAFPDGLDAQVDEDSRFFFPLRTVIPPGRLQLQADYNVTLTIGGRKYGPSKSHDISLQPDTYAVTIRSDEVFLDQSRQVSIASNDRVPLSVPEAIAVRVVAQPGNCKVSINGREIDETPFSQNLVPDTYEFSFDWPALGESRTVTESITPSNTDIFGSLD